MVDAAQLGAPPDDVGTAVSVAVGVTWKWFGWPGMTSRLKRNGRTQNEWMTSLRGEVEPDRLVRGDLQQRQLVPLLAVPCTPFHM